MQNYIKHKVLIKSENDTYIENVSRENKLI